MAECLGGSFLLLAEFRAGHAKFHRGNKCSKKYDLKHSKKKQNPNFVKVLIKIITKKTKSLPDQGFCNSVHLGHLSRTEK